MDRTTTEGGGGGGGIEESSNGNEVVDEGALQIPPPPPPPPPPTTTSPNFIGGKHRLAAAISLLHQQILFAQDELDQLETLGGSSIICKELVLGIESIPDALLPMSPPEIRWQRWFQGPNSSRNRKRWI